MTTIVLPRNQYRLMPPVTIEVIAIILQIIYTTLRWCFMCNQCSSCNFCNAELQRTRMQLRQMKEQLEQVTKQFREIHQYAWQINKVTDKVMMEKNGVPHATWAYNLAGHRVSSTVIKLCYLA